MAELIGKEMLIPEVISRYPSAREVFDKYGLKGCGGAHGPQESIEFFSRAHMVDLAPLLAELRAAAEQDRRSGRVGAAVTYQVGLADVLYRRFMPAALLVALTIGGGLGGLIMAALAFGFLPSVVAPTVIQAHANAQVYGFVALMAMGFAYQALPRFKLTTLWGARLAYSSLFLMLGGVTLRFALSFFPDWAGFTTGVLFSALLQLAAASFFALVMVMTFRRSGRRDNWDQFVYGALFWLVVSAIVNAIAPFLSGAVLYLIPVQLLGFITMLIFGVSLRILPTALGFPALKRDISVPLFWGLNLALLGQLAFTRWDFAGGLWLSRLLFLMVAAGMAYYLGVWGRVVEPDRSIKFVRAAYLWLQVSALLLVLAPLVPALRPDIGYHALTMGFITLMIVAVSSKVLPVLSGVDRSRLSSLMVPFVLLNLAAVLRAPLRPLAEAVGGPTLWVVGLSGALAISGLGIWGYELLRVMFSPRQAPAAEAATAPAAQRHSQITPEMKVADVIDLFPGTLAVFVRFGFTPLQDPQMRQTMGKVMSVAEACRMHGIDLAQLLTELNQVTAAPVGPAAIRPQMRVAEVLEQFPHTLSVFLSHGFTSLQDPEYRQVMGQMLSVEGACRIKDIPVDQFVTALNQSVNGQG